MIKTFFFLLLCIVTHSIQAAPDSSRKVIYKPIEIQLVLTDSSGKDTVKLKNTYTSNHPQLQLKQSTSAQVAQATNPVQSSPPSQKNETTSELLAKMLLGILIGTAGQGIRVIAGLKKMSQTGESFDSKQTLASFLPAIIIGGICGLLVIVDDPTKNFHDRASLLAILAAGYAGSDFIEAFVKKHLTPEEKLERKMTINNQQPK